MKEASFWRPLEDGKVRCELCPHACVLAPGGKGFCRVRYNEEGKLYNASYGALTAMNPDPIEKKPLFHFKPGSTVYSIGTFGCNLACDFCQNHEISQGNPNYIQRSPEEIVKDSERFDCIGIAFTYSEPITWIEFVLDVSKLNSGYNILVTNGYINEDPLEELIKHIDAANVDIKGDDRFYRKLCHSPYIDIANNVKTIFDSGVHVEVTNLLIPGYNDEESTIRTMIDELAAISTDIPVHFSRFFPHFKMKDTPPTPLAQLDKAYSIAKDAGMKHIYLGNVQGMKEDTYCPNCGTLLVKRSGFYINDDKIADGKCPKCGEIVFGLW